MRGVSARDAEGRGDGRTLVLRTASASLMSKSKSAPVAPAPALLIKISILPASLTIDCPQSPRISIALSETFAGRTHSDDFFAFGLVVDVQDDRFGAKRLEAGDSLHTPTGAVDLASALGKGLTERVADAEKAMAGQNKPRTSQRPGE